MKDKEGARRKELIGKEGKVRTASDKTWRKRRHFAFEELVNGGVKSSWFSIDYNTEYNRLRVDTSLNKLTNDKKSKN